MFIVFWGFVHGVLGQSASINLLLLFAGPWCDLESRWLATIPWRHHPRLQRRGWSVDDDSLHLSGGLAFVNYNTSYFCNATHELAPPQTPHPKTPPASSSSSSPPSSLAGRAGVDVPHLTGGTLGSGLGFRIWVQGYRVSGSDLGFRIWV